MALLDRLLPDGRDTATLAAEAGGFGSILHLGNPSPVAKQTATVTSEDMRTPPGLLIEEDIWLRFITPSAEYTPDTIRDWRAQARNGTLRYWFSFADEAQRVALTGPLKKLRELVRCADFTFEVPRNLEKLGLSQELLDLASELRDYMEDEVEPHLPDAFAETGVDAFYCGLAADTPHFRVKGYRGKWESLEELEQVASRRFEWNVPTRGFRVYADAYYTKPIDVQALLDRHMLVFLEIDKAKPLDQRGMLWQLYDLWVFYQYIRRYWAETVRDTGKPIFRAGFPQGDTKAEAIAKACVQKLAHDLRVAAPSTVTLENLVAPTQGSASGGSHQQLLEFIKRDMAEIMLGHSDASSPQVGAGSQSVADQADDDTAVMVNGILRRMARFYQTQLIHPMIERAVGSAVAALICPRLTVKLAQTPNYATEAGILAQVLPVGMKVSPKQAAAKIGYDFVGDDEPFVEMPKTEPGASGAPLGKAEATAKAESKGGGAVPGRGAVRLVKP